MAVFACGSLAHSAYGQAQVSLEPPIAPSIALPNAPPSASAAGAGATKAAAKPTSTPAAAGVGVKSAGPNVDVFVGLVRATLMALNQANQTGNYTVLQDMAAPEFRAQSNTDKLAESFESFRALKIDLMPTAVISPEFAQPPGFDQNGNLRLVGTFPTKPLQVRFDLAYKQIAGQWRQTGLAVSAVPAGGAASGAASAPQAKAAPGAAAATQQAKAAQSEAKPAAVPVATPPAKAIPKPAPKPAQQDAYVPPVQKAN